MWSDSEGELRPREEALALPPAAAAPHIAQLNVSRNSRMHIGPKFVSVTQTVHSTEVIKGRVLGLRLEEVASARRLRCSVAVCACWAVLLAAALAGYGVYLALASRTRLDLDLAEPWYLRRGDWQAMRPFECTFLALPARYALVGHSAMAPCEGRYNCTLQMLDIQHEHQQRGWGDIGPNFLVSRDGLVFEGRGANVVGAMVRGWNARGVSLMFLGDYRRGHDAPGAAQLRNARALLAALVRAGALAHDYELRAHCQLVPQMVQPGGAVLDALRSFDRWIDRNVSGCLDARCGR